LVTLFARSVGLVGAIVLALAIAAVSASACTITSMGARGPNGATLGPNQSGTFTIQGTELGGTTYTVAIDGHRVATGVVPKDSDTSYSGPFTMPDLGDAPKDNAQLTVVIQNPEPTEQPKPVNIPYAGRPAATPPPTSSSGPGQTPAATPNTVASAGGSASGQDAPRSPSATPNAASAGPQPGGTTATPNAPTPNSGGHRPAHHARGGEQSPTAASTPTGTGTSATPAGARATQSEPTATAAAAAPATPATADSHAAHATSKRAASAGPVASPRHQASAAPRHPVTVTTTAGVDGGGVPAWPILAVLALLAVGAGAWALLRRGGNEPPAQPQAPPAVVPPTTGPSAEQLAVEAELQQLLADEHARRAVPPDGDKEDLERERVPTPV
jgi:hypothetical protein